MNDLSQRHYLKLDTVTQNALDELCRHLFTTKSELMRRYVRDGVRKDASDYADHVTQAKRSHEILASV